MGGTPAAGGSSPGRSRRDQEGERVPLFTSPGSSPMGSLKHRTGGSFSDVLVPGAAAADGPSAGPSAHHAAGASSAALSPAVLLCVSVASMGEGLLLFTCSPDARSATCLLGQAWNKPRTVACLSPSGIPQHLMHPNLACAPAQVPCALATTWAW